MTQVAPKSLAQCRKEMRDALALRMETFNPDVPEVIGSPSIDDVVRQGDIYLICVENVKGKPTQNRQLAPGTTQGSRHILEGDVTVLEVESFRDVDRALLGPAFQCKGPVEVTHPEHQNKILPEDTTWQVVYQRAFAEEIRRVQD